MPPNPKAKRNVQSKSTIQEDKPVASMIEKDGPIADSPLAIDLGEYPEGPSQDVRAFTVQFDPLSVSTLP